MKKVLDNNSDLRVSRTPTNIQHGSFGDCMHVAACARALLVTHTSPLTHRRRVCVQPDVKLFAIGLSFLPAVCHNRPEFAAGITLISASYAKMAQMKEIFDALEWAYTFNGLKAHMFIPKACKGNLRVESTAYIKSSIEGVVLSLGLAALTIEELVWSSPGNQTYPIAREIIPQFLSDAGIPIDVIHTMCANLADSAVASMPAAPVNHTQPTSVAPSVSHPSTPGSSASHAAMSTASTPVRTIKNEQLDDVKTELETLKKKMDMFMDMMSRIAAPADTATINIAPVAGTPTTVPTGTPIIDVDSNSNVRRKRKAPVVRD